MFTGGMSRGSIPRGAAAGAADDKVSGGTNPGSRGPIAAKITAAGGISNAGPKGRMMSSKSSAGPKSAITPARTTASSSM